MTRRRYNPDGIFWGGVLLITLWGTTMAIILYTITSA